MPDYPARPTPTMKVLMRILNDAESIRREFPEATDESGFYLVGGIIANAEDLLGGLKDEQQRAIGARAFGAGLEALGRRFRQ